MAPCIFCQIAAGQAPAERLWEDERVVAFLDIAPVNYGHTLVIPRGHYETFLEVPPDIWAAMAAVSRQVAQSLHRVLFAQGFNLVMNNGSAANQEVFHAHLHLIPRYQSDGLHFYPQLQYKAGEMASVARQLREGLKRG